MKKTITISLAALAIVLSISALLFDVGRRVLQRELVLVDIEFVEVLFGVMSYEEAGFTIIYDRTEWLHHFETGATLCVGNRTVVYNTEAAGILNPELGTVLVLGDPTSLHTQAFIENLESIVNFFDFPRDVFFWRIDYDAQDERTQFLMALMDVESVPIILHISDGMILSSHSYLDGHEVDHMQKWVDELPY